MGREPRRRGDAQGRAPAAPAMAPAGVRSDADELMVVRRVGRGVRLRRLASDGAEDLRPGDELSNLEIANKFRVGIMKGIRYSHKCNALLLFSTESGDYEDSVGDGAGPVTYSGEGLSGDQRIEGGNERIVRSGGHPVLLFREARRGPGEKGRAGPYKRHVFVGCVRYAGHRWERGAGADGRARRVVKFRLEPEGAPGRARRGPKSN